MHGDSVRIEHAHELIRDLDADSLLDREAPSEDTHQPRQLGDSDDLLVRYVADVRVAVERQRVMLAERVELDRAFDDLADRAVGTAVALGRKRGQKLGVTLVA